MGATPSPQKRQLMFSPSQFIEIKRSSISSRQTYGNFSCHQHKTTNEQVDKYSLEFASRKQLQNYYECFLQRYRQQYVVNTIEFVDLSQVQFCSNLYKAEVYIQHIPVRLGNITDIPYPDNLYILKNCLIGFAGLYSMIGFFQVNQDHICVNSYGEVKVWFNTDLSKNYPQDEHQQIKSQCDMVNKIIRIIEEDTNTQQLPIQFSQYLSMKNKKFPKFSEAIQLLNQYIEQYKPKVPKYCQSIFQLFKDSQQDSKVSLKQMMAEGQKERERPSQTGSIIINQIVVPRLDISRVGDQNRRESNVVQSQQQREQRQEQEKDRTNLRQTIKIEQNLYGGFSFGRIENNQNERIPTQKTQRIGHRYSKQMQQHRRLASHNKSMIQNYNRLSTKRTPATTDIKNSIKSQFTMAPIPPFVSTTRSVKPIVHFSYLPPSIHNSQILFGPQPLNQIRTSFISTSNSKIQQMQNFKINLPDFRVEGANQIRSRAVSMNTSATPKWGTHDMSKKQQKSEIINIGQKMQKEQKIQKQQKKIKNNKLNQSSLQNKAQNREQKKKHKQEHKQGEEQEQEQDQKQKQKQKQEQKVEEIDGKQKQQMIRKQEEVVKIQRCFYLTETGSEQIDPEIAADLLKYL